MSSNGFSQVSKKYWENITDNPLINDTNFDF